MIVVEIITAPGKLVVLALVHTITRFYQLLLVFLLKKKIIKNLNLELIKTNYFESHFNPDVLIAQNVGNWSLCPQKENVLNRV